MKTWLNPNLFSFWIILWIILLIYTCLSDYMFNLIIWSVTITILFFGSYCWYIHVWLSDYMFDYYYFTRYIGLCRTLFVCSIYTLFVCSIHIFIFISCYSDAYLHSCSWQELIFLRLWGSMFSGDKVACFFSAC